MAAIQHLAMNCRDMKAQVAFFMKHFGFRKARVMRAGMPNEFVMLRLGGFCMEMFQVKDPGELKGGEQKIGFKHLCFEVDSLEDSIAALKADGYEMEEIKDCSKTVPGMRNCFFVDMDGNRLEIMQGWKDE
jgi:glyoxylase I family protein